ncbi:MAG TPA: NADH-quinone oxidoreductase subunit N [Tepidisphaeraceae bacterium]
MINLLSAIQPPFIPNWADPSIGLRPFVAELWLIATIVAVLLTPFFVKKSNAACAGVALVGLAAALISLMAVGVGPEVVGSKFRGLLVVDHFAVLWKVLLLIFTMGIVLMWFSTTAPTMHEGDGPEFFTLLLGATLGMSMMASTSNLLMIFLAVEMASLPSYVLAGFRKTHRVGAEASLKYVLFGAATSAIMAYGLSMLYGLYGTLQVEQLAPMMSPTGGGSALLVVGIFGLIAGIGFKISAVPFHFWCPDVFEGASIDVSAFLSVASKGAALCLLLRIMMLIANGLGYQHVPMLTAIAGVIGVIGAVTATVGNTAAFVQTNIKRLLAYSSIAHAGYMLCALSLLVQHNAKNPLAVAGANGLLAVGAAQAILLYLTIYLFMNLGAFTVAGLIYRQTGSEQIDDYAGLGRRNPLLAICMGVFMFSLVGLPPFAGFIAKFFVMYVLGINGGWWWWLVAVIGLNTIFSLFYYMRVLKVMYLTNSEAPAFVGHPLGTAISVVCAAALLLMFIGTNSMRRLTINYGKIYVQQGIAANPQTAPQAPTAAALP